MCCSNMLLTAPDTCPAVAPPSLHEQCGSWWHALPPLLACTMERSFTAS
jgi:hypothetical protein